VAWLSGLGGWLATWWPWLAILVLGTGFGLAAAGRSPPLALWRDRMILRLPIAGSLVTRRDTARLARTLATMTRNGVPLMAAVETASGVLGNHALAWAVLVARDGLKEGGTLVGPLRETGLFPEMALRLIAAGEHTGQLDVMLSRTAEIYEASLARDVDRMTGLLTPILTVVIGLMVGGLVVSVMGALSGINELALR
jgi:type II secretory pathway component PulF